MPLGQGNSKQGGTLLGIGLKHLIEIAKAEKQQGIILEALPGLAVLFHHGSVRAHAGKLPSNP